MVNGDLVEQGKRCELEYRWMPVWTAVYHKREDGSIAAHSCWRRQRKGRLRRIREGRRNEEEEGKDEGGITLLLTVAPRAQYPAVLLRQG